MSSRCEARAGGGGASGAPFVGRGPRGTPGGKMTNVGYIRHGAATKVMHGLCFWPPMIMAQSNVSRIVEKVLFGISRYERIREILR